MKFFHPRYATGTRRRIIGSQLNWRLIFIFDGMRRRQKKPLLRFHNNNIILLSFDHAAGQGNRARDWREGHGACFPPPAVVIPRNQLYSCITWGDDFSNYNCVWSGTRRRNQVFGFIYYGRVRQRSRRISRKEETSRVRIHLMTPGNNLLIRRQSFWWLLINPRGTVVQMAASIIYPYLRGEEEEAPQ